MIIYESYLQIDTVDAGCKVNSSEEKSGRTFEYQIVGSQEANPTQGRISDESPLGKAMVGAKVGDTVEFEAPAGLMRFKILNIVR